MISPASLQTTEKRKHKSIAQELRGLSDRQLLCQVQLATRGERAMTVKILHHLNEIERRKLYLELGHSSLFDYCTRRLKYSSSAAWRRIQTARCIRRYPEVLALLHARELSLSTISLVAPILTDGNRALVLGRVRGKSHREVERVVSEYRPPVALRDRVRPVRVPAQQPVDIDRVLFERELARHLPAGLATAGAGSEAGRVPTEQKLFVQFLASEELMETFEEVAALLSNRGGEGTFAEVLEIVLTDFLDRHSPKERRRRRVKRSPTAATKRRPDALAVNGAKSGGDGPSGRSEHCRRRQWKDEGSQPSRRIPAAVRDEVFARDGGRCTYVARDGTRCGYTRSLQIDHIRPFAAGGTHEPSNLRLLCAKHNRLAAEKTLGGHVMRRFWRKE